MKEKNQSRRGFIGELSKVTLAGAAYPLVPGSTIVENRPDKVPEFKFLTAPYLQNLSENSVSILFITNQNSYSWIEYGEKNFDQKAVNHSDGFVQANNTLHHIKIDHLKPGVKYQYRVKSKPIVRFDPYELVFGDVISIAGGVFGTPDKKDEEVSCLILNDIHDRPHSFKELFAHCQNFAYDFVALNGDMFDYQTDEQQIIDHLIAPCTRLFATEKPFVMIRGNHETRGKYARQLKDYFSFKEGEYYFSFKQGPVHWIVLDTGEDKEDTAPVYGGIVDFDGFREEQAKWFEKEIQNPEFKDCLYRVVLMHIPPFHSGDWHGTMHCRKLFNPLFEKHNVDLVISGHTHKYGIHYPGEEHNYPIVIGGGPRQGNRTIIQFKANNEQLSLAMIRDDGSRVGEYIINKAE